MSILFTLIPYAQKSLENLASYAPMDLDIKTQPLLQPFVMPPDIDVKMLGQKLIPEYCLYRFEGTMFYPPLPTEFLEENVGVKNIPVHIVVFENDLFGVIYLTRKSMTLYHRIGQNLTATNYEDI